MSNCMQDTLDEAVQIITDIKNKFHVKICELNEAAVTNIIIRIMSKSLREYGKSRTSETDYNDSPHLFA